MEYRIKLYGHTTGDPESFCRNLAAVLDIGTEEVGHMLRNAPVVIAEGIDEKEAERLESRLSSIGALSIVEPTSEDIVPRSRAAAEAYAQIAAPEPLPFRMLKEDSLKWLAWSGVIAVVAGIFILFLVAKFTSTYLQLERGQVTPPRQDVESLDTTQEAAEKQFSAERAELAQNLIARIGTLEREIPDLQAKLKEVRNNIDLPNRRGTMLDLQNEIRSLQSELRSLKIKLRGLIGSGDSE